MTEKEIQLLGFERENMDEGYYYAYKIADGFQFLSNVNDEIGKNEPWFVEIFNTDPQIRFNEFGEVQALINLIEKRIINK